MNPKKRKGIVAKNKQLSQAKKVPFYSDLESYFYIFSYGVTIVSIKKFSLMWSIAALIGIIQHFMFLNVVNEVLIEIITIIPALMFIWILMVTKYKKRILMNT